MGWWKDHKSRAVIGDDPLDDAADFVKRVSSIYRRELGRLPTIKEFLTLMERTLDAYAADNLRDGGGIAGAALVLKSTRRSKRHKYRVGDYVAIPLRSKRFGCAQIVMISPQTIDAVPALRQSQASIHA